MSGLARILLESKVKVSGSDLSLSPLVKELKEAGAEIFIGHKAGQVPQGAVVVVTSMIASHNPELAQAQTDQHQVIHRSELLRQLMIPFKSLLVAGTHGKTTTTSLLTHVLLQGGKNPAYAIGGVFLGNKTNARMDSGLFFVAEADESDGTFLNYAPYGAIVTNIDNDHMDHYKTWENLEKAFVSFSEKVMDASLFFYCGDDVHLRKLYTKGTSYGFNPDCKLRGLQVRFQSGVIEMDILLDGKIYKDVKVNLMGAHNALNALPVFAMALRLGVSEESIRKALASFPGVKRRLEWVGETSHVKFYDDYAHHPTEIEATLKGLKSQYPYRRIFLLFQPHRYSRTRDCLEQYGSSFEYADEVLVTDIYAAGETAISGLSSETLVKKIKEKSTVPTAFCPFDQLHHEAVQKIRPFDVVVTMGAGDIHKEGVRLFHYFSQNPPKRWISALCFGGKSPEHEIACRSAKFVYDHLDPTLFDVRSFYIDKQGKWSCEDSAIVSSEVKVPQESTPLLSAQVMSELQLCEVAFPVLHGANGEDGTMQGFFEIIGLPFAGCSCEPSSIAMNKAVTKKLAEKVGIAVAAYVEITKGEWRFEKERVRQKLKPILSWPLFVKPVHLGSTVGVSKVSNENELFEAIEKGFQLDDLLLVEQAVLGREVEFSVMGKFPVKAFPPGEILRGDKVYDFEGKYTTPIPTTPQAELSEDLTKAGIEAAIKAYQSIGGDGYARVDMFLEEEGRFVLNEINPIPGFTPMSLFPKMCEVNGMTSSSLLNELICIGLQRQRDRNRQRL